MCINDRNCIVKRKCQIVKVWYIKLHTHNYLRINDLGFKFQVDNSNVYNMFVQLVVHLHSKKDDLYAEIFMAFWWIRGWWVRRETKVSFALRVIKDPLVQK